MNWLLTHYMWLQALHIISVISWMTALLYLPYLFFHHCGAEPGSKQSETFEQMEHRISRCIMTPAMVAALLFGLAMIASNPGLMKNGFMHAKLFFVFLLFALHGMMMGWRKAFAEGRNQKSAEFFRITNGIPALIMVVIVILAVVKPF